MPEAGVAQGRGLQGPVLTPGPGPEPATPTPSLGEPLLTLPGIGLLDQVLPLRLIGRLDEPVLAALGQHLLHGS